MNSTHIVKPGETLSSVARKYGATVQELAQLNQLANANQLQIGQLLQLPATRQQEQTKRPVGASSSLTRTTDVRASGGVKTWMQEHWQSASTYAQDTWSAGGDWVDEKWLSATDGAHDAWVKTVRLGHNLSDSLISLYREVESFELVHHREQTKTKKRNPHEKPAATSAPKSASRKHRDEVLKQLRDRLYATPHVVATSGVKLSRNERKMIVAAVGLCEINNDVFGSENRDGEFHWKPNGAVSYSRIVHVGLSYGYIQFTQDGGNLGRLLQRMRSKVDIRVMKKYFPNLEQLLDLCTEGLSDEHSKRFGKSGLAYWNKLSKADKAALLKRVTEDKDKDGKLDHPLTADEEIRGARVQKIAYVKGYPAIDLWEDYANQPDEDNVHYPGWASAFKAAGDHPPFQDAQLELAVEDYFNAIAPKCSAWNIRSATGLAFVTACAVRGAARDLLFKVGKEKCGVATCFETLKQEQQAIEAIAKASETEAIVNGKKARVCKVGSVSFSPDEKRRMNILLKDEFDFLTEDLYDTGTYDAANDR